LSCQRNAGPFCALICKARGTSLVEVCDERGCFCGQDFGQDVDVDDDVDVDAAVGVGEST